MLNRISSLKAVVKMLGLFLVSTNATAQQQEDPWQTIRTDSANLQQTLVPESLRQKRPWGLYYSQSLGVGDPTARSLTRANNELHQNSNVFCAWRVEPTWHLSSYLHWTFGLDFAIAPEEMAGESDIAAANMDMATVSTGLVVGHILSNVWYGSAAIGVGAVKVHNTKLMDGGKLEGGSSIGPALRFSIGKAIREGARIELTHYQINVGNDLIDDLGQSDRGVGVGMHATLLTVILPYYLTWPDLLR